MLRRRVVHNIWVVTLKVKAQYDISAKMFSAHNL